MVVSRRALSALIAGVVLAHVVMLQWLAQHWQQQQALAPLAVAPLYTRELRPAAPPATVAAPARPPARPRPPPDRIEAAAVASDAAVPAPATGASAAAEARADTDPTPPAASVASVAPVDLAAAPPPAGAASLPAPDGPAWLDRWPADTRLRYRLGGYFRGELQGDARVQWTRVADRYEVRIEIDIGLLASLRLTSQGRITADGLWPESFEEIGRNGRRAVTLGEREIRFHNGQTAPRPPGVQDAASQFVELAQRLTHGAAPQPGEVMRVHLARPAAVDEWTFDVFDRVSVATPRLGLLEALHMKPRPIVRPRGTITAEMWFAPALQYLPVRIRINLAAANANPAAPDTHLDLIVDRIEQR